MIKKSMCLLFSLIMIITTAGCSKDTSGKIMSFSLTADPVNLDPQITSDYNAILIIKNIYEGLLTIDENGELAEGVAEDYEISSDGLKYTFRLRDNAKWMHQEEENEFHNTTITAHDFVFAFQRLLNANTGSPYASEFYCIKNAQAINLSGLDVNELGVVAEDDYTLVIQLEYKNASFLNLLTSTAAMPCNQEFFEQTNGKYGLGVNSILSNGPFYISKWTEGEYVRIRQNTVYKSEFPVIASGVNLTVRNNEEVLTALDGDNIDTGVLYYSELTQLKEDDFKVTEFENLVWGIGFNMKIEALSYAEIRQALAMSIDRESISNLLKEDATKSNTIVPNNITISGQNFRELAGDEVAYAFDTEEAKQHFNLGKNQLPESASLTNLTIIIPKGYLDIFQPISQKWQKELQIYLNIEELDQEEYEKRLDSKDFDLAFISFSSDSNSPKSILEKFTSNSAYNTLSYNSSTFNDILISANRADDMDQMISYYVQAEHSLLKDACFIPLFFQKEYFVVRSNVSGIIFDSASKIPFFKYAEKS